MTVDEDLGCGAGDEGADLIEEVLIERTYAPLSLLLMDAARLWRTTSG